MGRALGTRQKQWLWALWILGVAAGCTVAIPAADKFPEAQDAGADVAKADTGAKDTTDVSSVDTPDGADVADVDAIAVDVDGQGGSDSDATEVGDADAQTVPDADAMADAPTDQQDGTVDAPDVPGDVTGSVDAGVACTPADCDDADPCTQDTCKTGDGCIHLPLSATPCADDGLPCTADTCVNGSCSHGKLNADWCLIQGACHSAGETINGGCATCNPLLQQLDWSAELPGSACTDGTVCTSGDKCQGTLCLPGTITTCDDANPCTVDTCDPLTGCTHQNDEEGKVCPSTGVCQLPGFCASGTCQAVSKLWQVSMDAGLGDDDRFVAARPTSSGQVIVAGETWSGGQRAGWALRLSPAGSVLESLPAPTGGSNAAWVDVAVAPDDTVGLLGWVEAPGNPTATQLTLLGAGGVQLDIPVALAGQTPVRLVSASGGWLLLGGSAVTTLGPSGSSLWLATIPGNGVQLREVVALPDGGALVAGAVVTGDAQVPEVPMVARLSAQGALVWQRTYAQSTPFGFLAAAVVEGRLVLVASGGTSLWFVELDADGGLVREAQFAAPISVGITAVTPVPDGSWRVTGQQGPDVWIGAYSAHGALEWSRTWPEQSAGPVAILPDTGLLLASATSGAGPHDGVVLRTDPWGEPLCANSQLCANLTLLACVDVFSCTADVCGGGVCSHPPLDAAPCSDGNACTAADTCVGGVCAPGGEALEQAVDVTVAAYGRVTPLADGGLVVTGTANTIRRLAPEGSQVWQTTLAGGDVVDLAAIPTGVVALGQAASPFIQWFGVDGSTLGAPVVLSGLSGGTAIGVASDPLGPVFVLGTADPGGGAQTAWLQGATPDGTLTVPAQLGTPGKSAAVAIAAPMGESGVAALVQDGNELLLIRLGADGQPTWVRVLSQAKATALAPMPDGGWVTAGWSAKGVTVERRDPYGAFEFSVDWPITGILAVSGVASGADGSIAIAVTRTQSADSQAGILRFGPLGGFLSATWGEPGSIAADMALSAQPPGFWAVGHTASGGWRLRLDAHGGTSCAVSGSCIAQSLVCDDGNPCTQDGCAAGLCTIAAPADSWKCANGNVCTADNVCPLFGSCGDGKCNAKENPTNCPGDCVEDCESLSCDDGDPCTVDYCLGGACTIGGVIEGVACGLGKACAAGVCALPACGDGVCAAGETSTACPGDCPVCGDGLCGTGENNHTCPADCSKPATGCQNMCGWKNLSLGGTTCWCDASCLADCCEDKATFCP